MLFIAAYDIGAMPRALRSAAPKALRSAWEYIGVMWHRQFRPRHFTRAAYSLYAYLPRAGERYARGSKPFRRSYTGRKLRKFGHTHPLVYSGVSRSLTAVRDVRPTSKGVRIVMRAPALNFKHPKSSINMREELTIINSAEKKALRAAHGRVFDELLRAVKGPRRRVA